MTSKSLPQSFLSKKAKIISSLAVSAEEYDDLSPKGSVDEGIRELIDEINGREGWVTTSSCAGRISVFLEGKRSLDAGEGKEGEVEVEDGERTKAGVGGKGGGGRWLFVSHDPIPFAQDGGEGHDLVEKLGLVRRTERKGRKSIGDDVVARRFVHFKFEPMVCSVSLPFMSRLDLTRVDTSYLNSITDSCTNFIVLCNSSRVS
jgi:tRNA wybutosine-synthesizing protein 3